VALFVSIFVLIFYYNISPLFIFCILLAKIEEKKKIK